MKRSLIQKMFLACSVLASKVLVASNVRIIRLPFAIIGREQISFGAGFSAGRRMRLECLSSEGRLVFGKHVKINDDVHIGCIHNVAIGDYALIGSKVLITDHQHGVYNGQRQTSPCVHPDMRPLSHAPVCIECNVWIGEMVCVLPGVTIGQGAIVGAGSIVTTDIPPNTIAVGNPCRPIKRFNEETCVWECIR